MPPFASPPPAESAAAQNLLLEESQRLASIAPRLAFEKASLLADPLLRDRMRRDMFFALSARDPQGAAVVLPGTVEARWLPALPFAQALDIAWHTVKLEPALSKKLLMATAARNAPAALRDVRQYIELPYGLDIWMAAASAAPDQAAALAEGTSPVAEITRAAIRRSGFSKTPSAPAPAPAETLLRIRQNPGAAGGLSPGAIIALGAAARTEDERETALALLKRTDWDAADIAAVEPGALRGALALMAEFDVTPALRPAVVRAALRGIDEAEDPVREAVHSAAFLAGLRDPEARQAAIAALPKSSLGALLHARVDPSRQEAQYFPASRRIAVADLFPGGVCLQRYFFHNDDDGVESFESFLAAYDGDAQWSVERIGDAYVHLRGKGMRNRRIEIYANVPLDLQSPANFARTAEVTARQGAVTAALGDRKPTVLVHRGHDHHFDKTRPFLHSGARLVYLGSCFGSSNVEDVVTRCRRAQMIATRGVGATSVNDPFLRALNRTLLSTDGELDWDRFWDSIRPALSANEHFSSYIPPHRNEAAVFLAGWYRYSLTAP